MMDTIEGDRVVAPTSMTFQIDNNLMRQYFAWMMVQMGFIVDFVGGWGWPVATKNGANLKASRCYLKNDVRNYKKRIRLKLNGS